MSDGTHCDRSQRPSDSQHMFTSPCDATEAPHTCQKRSVSTIGDSQRMVQRCSDCKDMFAPLCVAIEAPHTCHKRSVATVRDPQRNVSNIIGPQSLHEKRPIKKINLC